MRARNPTHKHVVDNTKNAQNVCNNIYLTAIVIVGARLGSSEVERQPCKLLAAGSNPARGSKPNLFL